MTADEPKRRLSVHDVIGALGDLPESEDCVSAIRKQRDAADRPSVTDNARAAWADLSPDVQQHMRDAWGEGYAAGIERGQGRPETTATDEDARTKPTVAAEDAEDAVEEILYDAGLVHSGGDEGAQYIVDGPLNEVVRAVTSAITGLLARPAPNADATMPIIREAQERAWDEGWDASVDAANKCDIAGGDPCGDCAICRPPNPYTEKTDR